MKDAAISANWIVGLVRDFIIAAPQNSMRDGTAQPAWDSDLLGFASIADPIWQQYEEHVGAFHWTPWEGFSQHCPDAGVQLDHRQIDAVFLCFLMVRTSRGPRRRIGHLV